MIIRPLKREELHRIQEIDVSEDGDIVYRFVGGQLEIDHETWRRLPWDAAECQRRVAIFEKEMDRGDVFLGAFDDELLVGFASLRHRLEGDMAQLGSLAVSQSYRRQGTATSLVQEVFRLAQECGARRIYVSATPSRSAVGFYLRQGFKLAEKVNPELFALEPEDIHLIKEL